MNYSSRRSIGSNMGKRIFNFAETEIHEATYVPKELLQITAEKIEVQNRIRCFVKKKREEIDQNNSIDYNVVENLSETLGDTRSCLLKPGCARVNSAIVKQEYSKCHLKVSRIKNIKGPQTRPSYLKALDKLMAPESAVQLKKETAYNLSLDSEWALRKRLDSIEQHLYLSPSRNLSMHARLKEVENRILRLESISPEYWHFLTDANVPQPQGPIYNNDFPITNIKYPSSVTFKRKAYTIDEINFIILQIQNYK